MAAKPSSAIASKSIGTGAPNATLYVKNLPEKLNKNDLKRALYMLCSTYGPVLDIVTTRDKMRGQAHVVYRDIQTSTQAMRALQGFEFFGKEMVIAYGKGESKVFPKLRGTFAETTSAAPANEATEFQRSIFNAPPPIFPPGVPRANGATTTAQPSATALEQPPESEPHGVKRPRGAEDEEGSEGSEAPMDEDDDDDAPMEEDEDSD